MAQDTHISICERADYCSYIDGWRGIAILMVLAVHTSQHFGNNGHGNFLFTFSEKFLTQGARGVQLFYILSAFTLFNSSYRRFKTEASPKTGFYLRRAFRILPLWFTAVGLYCVLRDKPLWVGALSATFLFGVVRYDPALEVVPGGWSLFVEETFYLMLPLVFARVTTLPKAACFSAALYVLALVWSYSPRYGLPIPQTNSFVFMFPANHWFFFGIGIMLYHLVCDRELKEKVDSYCGWKWKWDLAALCLMPVIMLDSMLGIGVMFAVCIYASSVDGTLLNRLTNSRVLRRFGVYCFSIYLFHTALLQFTVPFMQEALRVCGMQQSAVELRFCLAFPVVALMSAAVGFCCFNLIERPSVQLGRRVIGLLARREPSVAFQDRAAEAP